MRIFSTLLFFLFTLNLSAQSIWIKGGIGLPSGSYSNSNIQKSDNRFAQSGYFYALQVDYPVLKKTSVIMQAGQASQRFDASAFEAGMAAQTTQNTLSIQKISDYQSSYALAGIRLGIGDKRILYGVQASFGFMQLRTPAYIIQHTYPSNTGYEWVEAHQDMTVAFAWELFVNYKINSHLFLQVQLEHFNATFQVPSTTYISGNVPTVDLQLDVYQAGIGLGYRF
ncbi:MAG: outer membrane beta-barrel protein [Bacteroidia bacterium]|jgi:hypothetical protein